MPDDIPFWVEFSAQSRPARKDEATICSYGLDPGKFTSRKIRLLPLDFTSRIKFEKNTLELCRTLNLRRQEDISKFIHDKGSPVRRILARRNFINRTHIL